MPTAPAIICMIITEVCGITLSSFQGVNLSRFQTSGQLVYVDCLSRLLDKKWAESDATVTTPTNQSATTITYTLDRYIIMSQYIECESFLQD